MITEGGENTRKSVEARGVDSVTQHTSYYETDHVQCITSYIHDLEEVK